FTSGGTEADNIALQSAVRDLGCTTIITSMIEHSAVIKTAQLMDQAGIVKLKVVQLDEKGHVDLKHLEELLAESDKAFVSLMHGNNEIANLLPLHQVGDLCEKYDAIFHSDTVQTMGHYRFNTSEMKVHFLTCAAHKLHGPKGVGFLYVRKPLKIKAMITGGGQERQLRGGTENLYGIVGLAKAIQLSQENIEDHQKHVWGLKEHMIKKLEKEIPGVEFNGDSASEKSLYTVLNVTLPANPNSGMMLFLLDLEGIACSGGSACSSGAAKGSHVLEGINAIQPGRASLRFSFSRFTTKKEVNYAVSKLKVLCGLEEREKDTVNINVQSGK
ncbi:MAG: aminotransferase class V-fold PLP-dependent enzyme, partial [Flavobacteriales bacterium]|nr:aminotransferase class V-fold PLP-dependent enzyme [Flavobacteriales bacterium]